MLVTSKEMLTHAVQGKYAVAAINTQGATYDIIRAICEAAQNKHSPIIIEHNRITNAYAGDAWFLETAKWCAQQVDVPVAIHLDHCETFDVCVQMMKLGFTSIMYDGSALPLEENARRTEEVVKVCHACCIPVEAELGALVQRNEKGEIIAGAVPPSADEVKAYLTLCHPDFLAVGIGNQHGYYSEKPLIHLELLDEIRRFTQIPLVLHGATGLDDDVIQAAIEKGIAKINISTEIRHAHIRYLKQGIEEHKAGKDNGFGWQLSRYVCDQLTKDVERIIESVGSAGKA